MSSLIAKKVKTNKCLVCLILYCTHYLGVPLFPTYTATTITITAYSIFFSHNYSLFTILLTMEIFKPKLFRSHATSQNSD